MRGHTLQFLLTPFHIYRPVSLSALKGIVTDPWLDISPDKFPLDWVMFSKSVGALLFEEIIETFYIRMLSTFITDSGWQSGGNEWRANKMIKETDTSLTNITCRVSFFLLFSFISSCARLDEEGWLQRVRTWFRSCTSLILRLQMMSPVAALLYWILCRTFQTVERSGFVESVIITASVQACVCWILIWKLLRRQH